MSLNDITYMPGSYALPYNSHSHQFQILKSMADSTDILSKSTGYQASEGIIGGYGYGTEGLNVGNVSNTAPDAQNLRVQFLHGVLEQVSFEQDDAMLMKLIPKEKVYSNTFEWTQFQQYGGAGDGFTVESGFDSANTTGPGGGLFGVNQSDDNFIRQVLQVKYMVATRTISLPETLVRNIANPESTAEKGATLELISKANLSAYFGDSKMAISQFNGLIRQIMDYLINNNSNDYSILYDAGGNPIDKYLLEDIAMVNRNKFGKGDLLLLSTQGFGDAQKSLFPNARYNEGSNDQSFGSLRKDYLSIMGNIKLEYDPMLRVNRPLVIEGSGSDGRPLATATLPTASGQIQGTLANITAAAASSSTGAFYLNQTVAATVPAAAPNVPTGDGNQASRLVTGANYYYAISVVVGGLESLPFVIGATAVNSVSAGSPPAINPTAGNLVTITIPTANLGSPSAATCQTMKIRVYRYGGPGAAAPTSFSQFNFLMDSGTISAANTVLYDNGMYMPNTDNGFLITTKKNGANGWFLAQLLPLMRRKGLPAFVMGDVLAMLMFVAPVLLVPRHHVWIRNIGRAS